MSKNKSHKRKNTVKLNKRIKISACYIVKNEEENLKTSLESLKQFVDEIIVVDTGSSDATVDVAKNFGAKIFYESWQNDFSTPRNIALNNASGDWIIFLDADEYFTSLTAKNIRFAVERAEQFRKNAMLVYLVNIDVDDGNKILDANYIMRIFKNLPQINYVGKIHEELRVGDNPLTEVTFAPPNILTLYHTGYSSKLNRTKAERNLKLLLEELAETNEPQRIYGYIAECYKGLDDLVNAEKFAVLDIESVSRQKMFSTRSYRIMLNILADIPERLSDREKFAAKAVENFPAIPEFTAELAECYAAQENYPKAVETMTQALQKFENYRGLEPSFFDKDMAMFAEHRIKIWLEKF